MPPVRSPAYNRPYLLHRIPVRSCTAYPYSTPLLHLVCADSAPILHRHFPELCSQISVCVLSVSSSDDAASFSLISRQKGINPSWARQGYRWKPTPRSSTVFMSSSNDITSPYFKFRYHICQIISCLLTHDCMVAGSKNVQHMTCVQIALSR